MTSPSRRYLDSICHVCGCGRHDGSDCKPTVRRKPDRREAGVARAAQVRLEGDGKGIRDEEVW